MSSKPTNVIRAPRLHDVRLLLNVVAQRLCRRSAPARHQIVEIRAGQIVNHFALGDVRQQSDPGLH